jgi:hypothetical protein
MAPKSEVKLLLFAVFTGDINADGLAPNLFRRLEAGSSVLRLYDNTIPGYLVE